MDFPVQFTGSPQADKPAPLISDLRTRLDSPDFPTAELEASLRDRVRHLTAASDANPFNHPLMLGALEISRLIDKGEVTQDSLTALVQRLSIRCYADRAEELSRYMQNMSVAENDKAIAEIMRSVAGDPMITFDMFKNIVERPCFGIVLTAHPTFGRPMALAYNLMAIASGMSPNGKVLDSSQVTEVIEEAITSTHLPPDTLTLKIEHDWSLEALGYIQSTLDHVCSIVLDVAAKLYPDQWHELSPCLVTVATWVGYDLDGRSDIAWSETVAKRILVKLAQLKRHCTIVDLLRSRSATVSSALAPVSSALEIAIAAVERQYASIDHVVDQSDAIGLVAQIFMETQADGIVRTDTLVAIVDQAIRETSELELKRDLCVFKTALIHHGLGVAHTHVRLNSAQLHNAIRKQVGMESTPNDPSHRRTYMTTINDLLGRVKPETINFATLMMERTTAKRLFMIVQQFTKYIDAQTPVRFLIAETEAGFTLLTALYFARLFGVEQQVEISPLFETAEAIERGDAIMDEALRSPHYRTYVKKLGRICIQFGFSDSGRYLGQMTASFQLERLRLRLAAVLERHGLSGVQLVLFNTNGESIGRGGHPKSLSDRVRYLSPPVTRASFASRGIAVKEELSFQGGDGFLHFMGLPAALSVVRVGLETLMLPDQEAEHDPVYSENDFAVEFFAAIGQSFGELVDDPNYGALLGAYGTGLAPRSGSRPGKRQHEGALRGLDVAHVSQLRAIPNNTILQQVGLFANTIYGVGGARSKDPELFDQLRRTSPRFKRAMEMVGKALGFSDLDILRAYIDTFDPGLWMNRSGRTRSMARASELREVAGHLEGLELHPRLMKLFRRLQTDFLLLTERANQVAGGMVGTMEPTRRETLLLLHMIRLALIHRIYLLAIHIPEFSPRHGISRDILIAQILRLDIPTAVALLKDIFPKTDPVPISDQALAEPATYRGDVAQGYAREHANLFDPMLALYRLNLILGSAIGTQIGALG